MNKVKRNIALIAHDTTKQQLLEWAKYNVGTLSKHCLSATGTTGKLLSDNLGLKVEKFLSGPLGGDQMIGAKIAEKEIDLVIFFWDPLDVQAHGDDIRALLRLSVLYNIPLACNRTTADFIISSPLFDDESYEKEIPDHTKYLNREIKINI